FVTDVRPIFTVHCIKCHGPEKHSGGLRLDSRDGAMRGGDSGKSLLGGSLESNELYARVSSTERAYRIPQNAEARSAEEIGTIKRWVEQGTPWPTPLPDTGTSFYEGWIFPIADWFDEYESEYYFTLPYALVFVGLLLLVVVVNRAKLAYRAD